MVPLKGILESSRLVWTAEYVRPVCFAPSLLVAPASPCELRFRVGIFQLMSALPGSTVSTRGGAECAYRGSVVMLCLATSPHLLLMMIVCRFYGDKTVETSIDATNGKATVFFRSVTAVLTLLKEGRPSGPPPRLPTFEFVISTVAF